MTAEDLLARKLELTLGFFARHRQRLLEDEELSALLKAHEHAFLKAQKAMEETGAASFCARCGREGRSCCGADMELHCDDALLLANLLVGVKFPSRRLYPKGCFFLGEEGCILRLRPLICRNFVCPELSAALGLEKTTLLQEALEEEARALFLVTERLKSFMAKGL